MERLIVNAEGKVVIPPEVIQRRGLRPPAALCGIGLEPVGRLRVKVKVEEAAARRDTHGVPRNLRAPPRSVKRFPGRPAPAQPAFLWRSCGLARDRRWKRRTMAWR